MSNPTKAEVTAALDVIERAAAKQRRRFSRAQLEAMSPEQVATALNEHGDDAFDHLEETEDE